MSRAGFFILIITFFPVFTVTEAETKPSVRDCLVTKFSGSLFESIGGLLVRGLEPQLNPEIIRYKAALSYLESAPETSWISRELAQDRLAFAIEQPRNLRDKIAQEGILNQYQSRTSGLRYAPKVREKVESQFLGISQKAYKKVSLDQRAKYGYLAPWPGSSVRPALLGDVGGDTYLLKSEKMGSWTTWTAGDSLDNALSFAKSDPKNGDSGNGDLFRGVSASCSCHFSGSHRR